MEKKSVRRLMITVDVEAQPGRANRDHVDRLILGNYPGSSTQGGIGVMMDVADKHGIKIVMFVDYCERALYGDAILDVAREVHRRDHDIQLHAHPEFFADTFWSKLNLVRPPAMNCANNDQANAVFDFLCESQALTGSTKPIGYRGGGYRYGPAVLRAMVNHGIKLDSSYIAARENQPLKIGRVRQFKWDNGCLELPVSCVNPYLNLTRDFDFNFNASAFSNVVRMMQCLEAFYTQQGEDAIAVMVMHSWSFSRRQENGFFSPPLPDLIERFDAFLNALHKKVEVITVSQALALVECGNVSLAPSVSLMQLQQCEQTDSLILEDNPSRDNIPFLPKVSPTLLTIARDINNTPLTEELLCNICKTPYSKFEDYNRRPKARCPSCGSVERQRTFVLIYDNYLKEEFCLIDKRVMALAPSYSENIIYKQRNIANIVTCDIRPEVKPDIVVDITCMPQITDASFDCVIASYVLTCVHDLNAAISEIYRILKTGGRFLFCDPITFDAYNVEYSDISTITNWYGQELYDKYRVGSFRKLGDLGVLEALIQKFIVKTFYGRDPITNSIWVWHAAIKSAKQETVLHTTKNRPILKEIKVCTICNTEIGSSQDENCKKCGSRPRTRTLPILIRDFVAPHIKLYKPNGSLLAFSMTDTEEHALRSQFSTIVSVSLYGNYRSGHINGVDVRDLNRFRDGEFSAISSILLFDYFIEIEIAIAECFRVLSEGGIFFTHIAGYRLLDGNESPRVKSFIETRLGYFDYLPSEANMPSILVGREWFISAIEKAGFAAQHVYIEDPITKKIHDWFIGVKPTTYAPNDLDSSLYQVQRDVRLVSESILPTSDETIQPTIRAVEKYSIKLPNDTGLSSLNIEVSAYDFGTDLCHLEFSEHAIINSTNHATDEVVCVQNNIVITSDNLGLTWRVRSYDSLSGVRFLNSFTPENYSHRLMQTIGWSAIDDGTIEGPNLGRLMIMQRDGRILASGQCGTANWHGSYSIDQSNKTIIFAEYHQNRFQYRTKPYALLSDNDRQYLRSNSVFRSIDGGYTWKNVLSLSPDDARHFHTVIADKVISGVWWASTGDKPNECRVFRSDNDGLSWEDATNYSPNVMAPPGFENDSQACLRTTAIVQYNDNLRWGADDIFGPVDSFDRSIELEKRTGARMYVSRRESMLQPVEVAYCGHPVRSIIDVGPGYIVMTEAYQAMKNEPLEPEVLFWSKTAPHILVPIMRVKNYRATATGFTYSRSSRIAKDGVFFTYRGPDLIFKSYERILRWKVDFT